MSQNSHSITDHTQTNWNGMTGKLFKNTTAKMYIQLQATSVNEGVGKLQSLTKEFTIKGKSTELEIVYPMGRSSFVMG